MENRQPYQYDPLPPNSIRLLGLNAASDCLSGTLKIVSLEEAPLYFGVSYAWGTQSEDVSIRIDGKVLFITSTLADGIRRLQRLTPEDLTSNKRVEWVWIDKICINQGDHAEKSNQIRLMGSVYSRAVRTLIWLGSENYACSMAWGLVDRIYDVFRNENPGAKFVADIPLRMYSDRRHTISSLPGWDHELWRHMRRLFRLPWFTRTWIIQEVALSCGDPIFLHGGHTYPWYRLGWASSWLRRNGYLRLPQVPNQLQNVETISNIRRSRTRWRLDALLFVTSVKCQATDQRDKVYGLLGLAAENRGPADIPDELRPNYDLDIVEVYTRVTLFFLRQYKSLSVLTRTSGVPEDVIRTKQKHRIENLPSWVPNWGDFAVPEREVPKSLAWMSHSNSEDAPTFGFPEQYNASGKLPAKLCSSRDLWLLRLGGLKVDIVTSVTQFDDDRLSSAGQPLELKFLRLWKAAAPFRPQGVSFKDWVIAWVKATTAEQCQLSGRSAEQSLRDGSAYLLDIFRSSEHESSVLGSSDGSLAELLGEMSTGGDPELFALLAANFCFNRALIVTSKCRLGIAPAGTRVDDLISVIFGGGVPYVLRPRMGGFLFVGESYVHRLMDGEAIQSWQQGELAEEVLELR